MELFYINSIKIMLSSFYQLFDIVQQTYRHYFCINITYIYSFFLNKYYWLLQSNYGRLQFLSFKGVTTSDVISAGGNHIFSENVHITDDNNNINSFIQKTSHHIIIIIQWRYIIMIIYRTLVYSSVHRASSATYGPKQFLLLFYSI